MLVCAAHVCIWCRLSGSHTHSEPRIVIIFSELLQTDRQTEWGGQTDVHRQTGRERRVRLATKKKDWKQGSKSKTKLSKSQLQETNHHCSGLRVNSRGLQLVLKMADRGERGRRTSNRTAHLRYYLSLCLQLNNSNKPVSVIISCHTWSSHSALQYGNMSERWITEAWTQLTTRTYWTVYGLQRRKYPHLYFSEQYQTNSVKRFYSGKSPASKTPHS